MRVGKNGGVAHKISQMLEIFLLFINTPMMSLCAHRHLCTPGLVVPLMTTLKLFQPLLAPLTILPIFNSSKIYKSLTLGD